MFELRITRRFLASHALVLYDGSLEPRHGHDWGVEVVVRAERLDRIGVVMDFHELERITEAVIGPLRGGDLNGCELLRDVNPSAENVALRIAEHIARQLPAAVRLGRVTVEEAPGCFASYGSD